MDLNFVSLLCTYGIGVLLSLFSGMLNQLQNWILMEPVLLWVLVVLVLSLLSCDTFYEGWIDSRLILVYKSILVIMQGCIRDTRQGLWLGIIDKLDDPM